MTSILLIFFGFLFYQLLLKPAFRLSPSSPNYYQQKQDDQLNLMKMWQQLQDFQKQQQGPAQEVEKNQGSKTSPFQKAKKTARPSSGFQGGEYIDYEEL